jgi:hypothetical protein
MENPGGHRRPRQRQDLVGPWCSRTGALPEGALACGDARLNTDPSIEVLCAPMESAEHPRILRIRPVRENAVGRWPDSQESSWRCFAKCKPS